MSWSIVVKAVWPQCVVLHTRHISCFLQEEPRDFSIYVEFRRVIMELGVVNLPSVLTNSQCSSALGRIHHGILEVWATYSRFALAPSIQNDIIVYLSSASTNPLKSHL